MNNDETKKRPDFAHVGQRTHGYGPRARLCHSHQTDIQVTSTGIKIDEIESCTGVPPVPRTPRWHRSLAQELPFRATKCHGFVAAVILRQVCMGFAMLAALTAESVRAQGYAPADAAGRMTVADGLEVRLIAAEPLICQPVAIEFDDRGRLWVIQYLQYPNPAALNRIAVDRYSRTVYDRVPEPPPRGPQGADRITILEDTDGDGRADRSHDFVSGLNLASGLAFGHGGVFVVQVPYLLFYPDRDRDDRPDGEPEVLLSGFGMEDAHSVANSLTWGPDGWLYGLQGSTVTAKVRGIEFQQGVWRYHPKSKRFELFCEGGGNMWGLDFDRHGDLFASTNVGGFVMLHGVQGGYYWKSFGKHGPLHNSYTYGFFDHVSHTGLTGGHVSVGGLFYEADALPERWRGRYIVADLLGHAVRSHELTPLGATHRARQTDDLLRANDTWFAPCDMTLGPDGALYVADWHDRRTAHPDPDADWDRSNGRIFAITRRGAKPSGSSARDLANRTVGELVAFLNHPNVWYRRRARRLLTERQASDIVAGLRSTSVRGRGPAALEALWALYGCAGLEQATAEILLRHPDADIRAWCVRLIGDEPDLASLLAARLVAMAATEADVRVRSQLACTARRIPAARALELAHTLLIRDLDGADPLLPLLLWWAVEQHAVTDREDTLARFTNPAAWRSAMIKANILERLMRRLAAANRADCDEACARMLVSAPDHELRRPLLIALDEGIRERPAGTVAPHLVDAVARLAERDPRDVTLICLAARTGDRRAVEAGREIAANARATQSDRSKLIDLFSELNDHGSIALVLDLATSDDRLTSAICNRALHALGHFDDPSIAPTLLSAYARKGDAWRTQARELLLSRRSWAGVYLAMIDRGELPAAEMALDQLGRFPILRDPPLAALVRKHWGVTRGRTHEERLAEVNHDLRAGAGDSARGRQLFRDRCALCHRLDGEGETIGPDLTFANRGDRDFLLVSLVDPAGVVRKEYQAYQLATRDGRVLNGLIVDQSPAAVTLRDAKGERTRVARSEIEDLQQVDTSLMPESLYKEFSPGQLRDLFRFLETAPAERRKGPP
jgi:putative membrane-bound dehydrogenase-like protein